MAFKTVLNSKKNATFVAWSARTLAEKAGAVLRTKLQSLLAAGETMPEVEFFQELLGRYLEVRSRQLAEADGRYTEEKRIARALRLERQRQMTQVQAVLRDARNLLDRRIGKAESSLHLTQRSFARRDAVSLVQLAQEAAVALRDPKVAWEPAAISGAAGSATLAEALEREAALLQQLCEDQENLQARLKQAGLEEKAAELEKAKVAVRGAATLLAGLYVFADMPFHAQRVRLRSRKGPGSEEEAPTGEGTPVPPKALAQVPEEVIVRLG